MSFGGGCKFAELRAANSCIQLAKLAIKPMTDIFDGDEWQMAPTGKRQSPRSARPPGDEPDADMRSMSELAYVTILEGLFTKRLPTGAFLSQNDLVKLTGCPLQPLRDALRVLQTEGVLTIHPRSGIQFLKPDMELARSTYQFRSIIERAAARAYAENGASDEIDVLLHDHRQLETALSGGGMSDNLGHTMEDLEARFHDALIGALHNPLIEITARRLKNYMTLIRLDRRYTAPLALHTLAEHIAVLEACQARDGAAAEHALSQHFRQALGRILGMT
jgi:DNA-binding GntR family transcriptional regulator